MNIHLLFKLLLVRLILSKAQTINFTGNQNGTITANDVKDQLNSTSTSTLLTITISNASYIDTDVYSLFINRTIEKIVIDLKTVKVDFSLLVNVLQHISIDTLVLNEWTSDIDLRELNLTGSTFSKIEIAVSDDNLNDKQKNPWALEHILIRNNYPQDRSLFDLISNWFDIIRSNQSTELILLNNTVGLYIYFQFTNLINRTISASNCSYTIFAMNIQNVVNSKLEFKNMHYSKIDLTFNKFNRSHLLIENITAVLLDIQIPNITDAQWSFKNFLSVTIIFWNTDLSFIEAIDNPAGITELSIGKFPNSLASLKFQSFTNLRYLTVANTEIDDNLTITLGNTNMTLTLYDNNIALKDKISNPSNVYEIQLKNGILSHPNFQNFTNLRQMSFSEIMIPSDSVIIMPDQENLTLTLYGNNMHLKTKSAIRQMFMKCKSMKIQYKLYFYLLLRQLKNGILSHPNFQNFTNLRQLSFSEIMIPNDSVIIMPDQENLTLTLYGNNMALKDKISNPSNVYEIQLKNGILSHPNFQNFTNLRQMSFSEIIIPSDSVIIMPDQENLTLRLSDLPDYSFELVKSINPKQFWEGNLYINGVKSNLSEIRNNATLRLNWPHSLDAGTTFLAVDKIISL
ncbi:hypothetical protein GJ496_009339 [Pomphorhynchus laevis]|nr:hypothetical protein GJ496_009339 [Pomphorhynchus laevis]